MKKTYTIYKDLKIKIKATSTQYGETFTPVLIFKKEELYTFSELTEVGVGIYVSQKVDEIKRCLYHSQKVGISSGSMKVEVEDTIIYFRYKNEGRKRKFCLIAFSDHISNLQFV